MMGAVMMTMLVGDCLILSGYSLVTRKAEKQKWRLLDYFSDDLYICIKLSCLSGRFKSQEQLELESENW